MPLVENKETVVLNSGYKIPKIALGTFRSGPGEVYNAVLEGVRLGVRHIDTAYAYGNEAEIGDALAEAFNEGIVKREELFITTKIWGIDLRDPVSALKESLKKLKLDYVDLYLIHWPFPLIKTFDADGNPISIPLLPNGNRALDDSFTFVDAWAKFQELPDLKLTRSVGVSNFTIAKLTELLNAKSTKVVPAVNQIEAHPFLLQPQLLEFCKSKNIVVEAHTPLGGAEAATLLENQVLNELAKKYGCSSAQMLISWALWRGTVALPKSVKPNRIHDNLFTVNLSDEDGDKINKIGEGAQKRYVNPDWSPKVCFDDDEKYHIHGFSWVSPNPTTIVKN